MQLIEIELIEIVLTLSGRRRLPLTNKIVCQQPE